MFPALSFTDCTVDVVSFHPTTTMFRSPAVCAPGNVTGTVAVGDCGVAACYLPKTDRHRRVVGEPVRQASALPVALSPSPLPLRRFLPVSSP